MTPGGWRSRSVTAAVARIRHEPQTEVHMAPDLWSLYALMLRSRLLEEGIAALWRDGLISGEMHLGTGEEAIVAGVVSQLRAGDAMALDHRGTAPLLMRGVDPVLIVRELLGLPDGLCAGRGGHMHLYSRQHLAASSGIVGAAGPAACGFALAAQHLNPGAIAVAFFGEGAMNAGMLLEALNLAAVWKLPVLFVCKDDDWSITTRSQSVTGGDLHERARGLGVPPINVDGRDVGDVWKAAQAAIARARAGQGPTWLHARCVHLEGHLLGFQLLRTLRQPLRELPKMSLRLTRSLLQPGGGGLGERLAGLLQVMAALAATMRDPRGDAANDPVRRARASLQAEPDRLRELEEQIGQELADVLARSLARAPAKAPADGPGEVLA
jgi:pyruvate dehydrogenase E1 component alpha subunit